jgi:ornithine cyclodeaminase/alanine dehydrogenase-like protein (mu-crystallin family)
MSSGPWYLSASDVEAAMPPVATRIELAERAMVALVGDAELPPKIGVHPRPVGSFAHAMPASLRPRSMGADGEDAGDARAGVDPDARAGAGARADPGDDLLGIKWVTGFPDNRRRGLPAISAVVVLSDPSTGRPQAILDGGPITAQRTAAVSGVALARFAAAVPGAGTHAGLSRAGDSPTVALIGAGVQGASHLEVIGHVLPGTSLLVHDRHPERAAMLAETARRTAGIVQAEAVDAAREATMAADIVITGVSFADPSARQVMTGEWLRPNALIVPIDYATMCSAEVAREAALFLVDERGQFLANREAGLFDGFPDPSATFGEAILAGTTRPATGRVVAMHLGVGLADVVFADAIVRRARAEGLGVRLPE